MSIVGNNVWMTRLSTDRQTYVWHDPDGTVTMVRLEGDKWINVETEHVLVRNASNTAWVEEHSDITELIMLREAIVRALNLTDTCWIQPPDVMLKRAHEALLDAAMKSDAIKGYLGYGGSEAHRDLVVGNGNLD